MTVSQTPADVRPASFDFEAFVARCNELGCITDAQRAELAGISVRTYYRWQADWEAGKSTNLSLERLGDLAERLGITSAALMGGAR